MVTTRRRSLARGAEDNTMHRMQALQEISEAIDQESNERGVPKKIPFHLLEAQRLRDAQAKQTAEQQRQGLFSRISYKIDQLKHTTYRKEWVLDAAEICSWLFTNALFGLWYNPIGGLAAWRNVDYSPRITTEWDRSHSVAPWWIIPYVIVYLMPFTYVLGLLYDKGVHGGLQQARQFYFVQIANMAFCYTCYVMFPVSIAAIAMKEPVMDSNWPTFQQVLWSGAAGSCTRFVGDQCLDSHGLRVIGLFEYLDFYLRRFTYTFVHTGMSTFCACPSMHVVHCGSMAWIMCNEGTTGSWLHGFFAFTTFFSTVYTKAHYFWDVPIGVFTLVSLDLIFQQLTLFTPYSKRGLIDSYWFPIDKACKQNNMSVKSRAMLIVLGPVFMLLGCAMLNRATGIKTDIVGMFMGKKLR